MLHQRHLPKLSSTKIKQLLTPNLSRARQNWTISVEITPNVHQIHQEITQIVGEPILLDFSLRRNFPWGLGNRVSRFSEIRLPCISKSQHLSTNSLPKLNAAEYFLILFNSNEILQIFTKGSFLTRHPLPILECQYGNYCDSSITQCMFSLGNHHFKNV